ncbi:MAG: hypothetical protein HYV28_02955, partial [Ignavibacteriales bacterium]|nr:hypothetical protein [Ignavibacteriales bacterium]
MQKTEILIINPVSGKGRGEKLQSTIIKHAKDFYPHINVLITSEKNQAKEYIQSSAKQCSKLFVAGGDGTLNEVVRGFQTGHDFVLYSIPIGSGNDFSRSAGTLNKSIQEIFQASVNPKYVLCDIGRVRLQNSDNSVLETAFLSSCGSGFDATVSKFSNRKTFLTGLPLYISSVMKALVHLSFIDVEIILDHTDYFSGEKLLVTIG